MSEFSTAPQGRSKIILIFMGAVLGVLLATGSPSAHMGESHGFTALQALQKATGLYDQLVASGKLDETWESGLRNVQVTLSEKGGKTEFRVSFQRESGTPDTVYIFLNHEGEYAGSNFEGK